MRNEIELIIHVVQRRNDLVQIDSGANLIKDSESLGMQVQTIEKQSELESQFNIRAMVCLEDSSSRGDRG